MLFRKATTADRKETIVVTLEENTEVVEAQDTPVADGALAGIERNTGTLFFLSLFYILSLKIDFVLNFYFCLNPYCFTFFQQLKTF